jgi:glycosyltransferase involved in cell wall biosynthesis
MKVLHAYTHHRGGGGAENAVQATVEVCRRHGLSVDVFARRSEDIPRNLLGRLEAGVSAIHAPGSVHSFARALKAFQPDVVHIYDLFPLISPSIVRLCSREGIPVVMNCQQYRLTCPVVTHFREGAICTQCLGGREYRAILNNCRNNLAESITVALYNGRESRSHTLRKYVSRFVAPSEFTRQWLIEHAGLNPDRVTAIAPVVSIPDTAADPASGEYIAFGGRFVAEKGIATVLAAARAGGLPFRLSRNEAYRVDVPVPPDIRVEVTRSRLDLADFYRNARALVFPSIWFETFGLVGAEAMSHGIPVIASRIGALTELIEDGVDGLLFEPGNSDDLAEKAARLWNSPELCRRMGCAARRKAISLWSPERHFERLLKLYEDVRNRRGGGAPD